MPDIDKQEAKQNEDLEIKSFLEGKNPLKHVVAIETYYDKNYADLIIHEPDKKRIQKEKYKPFVYIKDLKSNGINLYGNPQEARKAMAKWGITIKALRVTDDNGAINDRLNNGYKWLVETSHEQGYRAIQNFFRYGGLDMWKKTPKQATFGLEKPSNIDSSKLYTFIGNKNGISLFWNNKESRFEAHITNKFISTFTEKKDDDENTTFITIKGGSKSLDFQKDFSLHYYEEKERYVVILNPEIVKDKDKPSQYHPLLENYPEDEHDEVINSLKSKGLWEASDDKLNIKLKNEAKRAKEKVDKQGGLSYKKVTFRYNESHSDLFHTLKNEEQFMISTGIRLFKGYEFYNEVHKFIFDLETTGLYPELGDRIFMIGAKDNRGSSKVLAVREMDNDNEERRLIVDFFNYLYEVKPAIVYGYNSENFDFNFLLKRAELLGMDISKFPTSLVREHSIKRRPGATLKLGGETEVYTQTNMWGYNVVDIYHAVRRTMAIKSDLLNGTLKYVCKFEKIAKPNRVYIPGDKIYKIWRDDKWYAVHNETNDFKVLGDEFQGTSSEDDLLTVDNSNYYGDNTVFKKGSYLVEQYLLDDLWETEQVDERYNVDRFMVGQMMPTGFVRTTTMGGAAQWNLLMTAWSYENGLAIPHRLHKTSFTGGLSRTFMLGKFWNVYKFDFSGLYPSIQLELGVFPKHDVTSALERFLLHFKLTRDKFKAMGKDMSLDEKTRMLSDTKQLPLKIMNNSNFGANGSTVFNWADFVCAERITCTGRLYLRRMIQFFMKYNCIPTVCDTDGINMVVPEMVSVDIEGNKLGEEVSIETYEFTTSNGKTHRGANALVEKFNEEVLAGKFMKLDNDGMWPSAINISRKNYANMEAPEEGKAAKIKMVGNTLKSKTMPEYIKEFIDTGIRLLLEDKGAEFVEYYYDYKTKIITREIPLKKIADKARVKLSTEEYNNRGTNKKGQLKPKQAHMELIIQDDLKVSRGDIVYYVNNGVKKSHSFTTVDKTSGKLMAYVISQQDLESNPEKEGEYNVAFYLEKFNKRVAALLTPFKSEVRDTLIQDAVGKRQYYTPAQCELGYFQNPEAKDNIKNFFILEKSEVVYWNKTGLNPYEILPEFETEITYDGYEYQEKLELVRRNLAPKGLNVLSPFDKYKNGDVVVTFQRKWFAENDETLDRADIPLKFTAYLSHESWMSYPLDEDEYQEFIGATKVYGDKTTLKYTKEFHINLVENGYLKLIREI
jgi:DNA polymerase, archaea type